MSVLVHYIFITKSKEDFLMKFTTINFLLKQI